MSELFINTIADSCAGTAIFSLPYTSGTGGFTAKDPYAIVVGFLSEDPVISMKTNWEALIPDATSLSDWTAIAGMGAVSWIASSKATWKGTDPITLTLNFYLLTYRLAQVKKTTRGDALNMPVSEQAARFASLLAISPKNTEGESAGKLANFGINVHGNYRANLFEDNKDFTGNAKNEASEDRYYRLLKNADELINDNDSTVNIVINGGGKPSQFFTKMLLSEATFTPSPVRCGYWENVGSSRVFHKTSEPLYIKVSATFRLAHTATVRDAVRMFTGETSL